jgi:hypothetical protein
MIHFGVTTKPVPGLVGSVWLFLCHAPYEVDLVYAVFGWSDLGHWPIT